MTTEREEKRESSVSWKYTGSSREGEGKEEEEVGSHS